MVIRVGIRGYCGLLGSRLALAIQKQSDMEVTVGIVKNDLTLKRLDMLPIPDILLLDEKKEIFDVLDSRYPFQREDQVKLNGTCDILIDASVGDIEKRINKNKIGPVIYQSGDYPHFSLISPPYVPNNTRIFRQGDCILSALSPVIYPLEKHISSMGIHVNMQLNSRLHDYPTRQRIGSTYLGDELEDQINNELKQLKLKNIQIDSLYQRPGFDYYDITLMLKTKKSLTGKNLQEILTSPRIKIVDAGSTYEIEQHYREETESLGRSIAPISVYRKDLDSTKPKKEHRIRLAVYSKLIAVLPNIDSIRILAGKIKPLVAMQMTDDNMNFL